MVAVPAQLADPEEVPERLGQHDRRRALRPEPVASLLGEHVEPHQVPLHRKLDVLLPCDEERHPRQVDVLFGTFDLAGELLPRRPGGCVHGQIPSFGMP